MKRDEIKEYVPHREPMLLIDEINIDENNVAYSNYRVTGEEFFLDGHFPGNPVVPGVILCEIMAQASCLLIGDDLKGRTPFYAGLDNVRFKKPVKPGDKIDIISKIVNKRGLTFVVEGSCIVDDNVCATAKMMFTLIDNDKLDIQK